ncbi:Protein of unknown function [Gryllus bimaculatus]|nr:Protein of unknown function [Gryllus bimaculatus]
MCSSIDASDHISEGGTGRHALRGAASARLDGDAGVLGDPGGEGPALAAGRRHEAGDADLLAALQVDQRAAAVISPVGVVYDFAREVAVIFPSAVSANEVSLNQISPISGTPPQQGHALSFRPLSRHVVSVYVQCAVVACLSRQCHAHYAALANALGADVGGADEEGAEGLSAHGVGNDEPSNKLDPEAREMVDDSDVVRDEDGAVVVSMMTRPSSLAAFSEGADSVQKWAAMREPPQKERPFRYRATWYGNWPRVAWMPLMTRGAGYLGAPSHAMDGGVVDVRSRLLVVASVVLGLRNIDSGTQEKMVRSRRRNGPTGLMLEGEEEEEEEKYCPQDIVVIIIIIIIIIIINKPG